MPPLRPAALTGVGARLVQRAVHETLVGIGPDGLPEPALARRWSSSAAGREWSLLLGDGLRFHDGDPLAPADVVRSLRAFLRDETSVAAAVLAGDLDGGGPFRAGETQALPGLFAGGDRVVLRLSARRHRPFAPLASPAAAVVSPSGAGCGPFIPTVPRPGATGWQLSAFPGHWRGRPFVDTLVLRFADSDTLRTERRAGRVDVAPGSGLSADVATLLLHLDPGHPVLAAQHARRLIGESIDRDGLARFAPGGHPAAPLLPPSLLPPLARSGAAADAARFAGPLRLAVDRAVPVAVSQRVVAHLAGLGFDVAVTPLASGDVWHHRADVRLVLWLPEVPEARLALAELATRLLSPDPVRQRLTTAEQAADADARRAILHRAQDELAATYELVPLLGMAVAFDAAEGIHGLRFGSDGALLLADAWTQP